MDTGCVYDENKVIHELTQGLQMAQQLIVNPHSAQTKDILLQNIISSYDNALFILKSGHSAPNLPESSISFGSPGSEVFQFGQSFSGQQGENTVSRKRKGSPIWEDEVRVCNGLEGDSDDGFNWRKYGQKDILGAKFPRSYYRCSYRNVEKCFATKQVQKTDEGVFEIAYKGKHTCSHASRSDSPPPPPPSTKKHEITPTHQLSPSSPTDMLSVLRDNLTVNTSDLGTDSDTMSSLFSFPSTSSGLKEDYQQLQFPNHFDDEVFQVCSPLFTSPVNSESIFYSDWGSSESLDLLADPADLALDFEFNPLF